MSGSIPTYKDWMDWTKVSGKFRSSKLRDLDDAIKAYEKSGRSPQALNKVAGAYRSWRREKKDVEDSVRNRAPHYPVTALAKFLDQSVQMSPEEQEAFRNMMEMRRDTLRKAFENAKIEFGHKFSISEEFEGIKNIKKDIADQTRSIFGNEIGGGMVDLAKGTKNRVKGASLPFDRPKPQPNWTRNPAYQPPKSTENPLYKGKEADKVLTGPEIPTQLDVQQKLDAAQAMSDLTGIDIDKLNKGIDIGKAIKDYILNTVVDTIKDAPKTALFTYLDHLGESLPVVALVVGGFKTLKASAAAVKADYDLIQTTRSRYQFEPGQPRAALRGLENALLTEVGFKSADAMVESATLAVNSALHATVYGTAATPIIKIVKYAVQVILAIIKLGIQIRTYLQISKILSKTKYVTVDVFKKAPVLGAYFLLASDHSTIISMLATSFGKLGWMDEVETAMKEHIRPVLRRCTELITAQPYKLSNIPKLNDFEASASFGGVGEAIALHKFG